MRLGIAVALNSEFATLGGQRPAPGRVVEIPGGHLAVLTGMGRGPAADGGRRLIDAGARALLSWGTAAGLSPSIRPGVLVVPRHVIPAHGGLLSVDPAWRARVLAIQPARDLTTEGDLAESDDVLASSADKARLARRTGAIAADMESAALARVAARDDVPFMAVRAVSDSALQSLPGPVLDSIDPYGGMSPGAVVSGVLGHPGSWPALWRLGRGFSRARASLRRIVAAGVLDTPR